MRKRWRIVVALGLPVSVLAVALFRTRGSSLPPDLTGTLVFVSDRSGIDSLYVRHLPRDRDRRLTTTSEPVGEPRLSPDGARVAFSMGGRIGLVSMGTGKVRMMTLGVRWRDASPSWRPDGKGLVVSSRRGEGANASLHLLDLESGGAEAARDPLTQTRGVDDLQPVFAPDGLSVVFVREDNLFRVSLADGRTARLTGSFRRYHQARSLPSGRLVALWSQGKQYGVDVMDDDGKNRETLVEGPVFYRTLAPSPAGRHLAVTFTFDLGFHPAQALRLRQPEEVRLLDEEGRGRGALERSWRHANHSPDWGR